MNGRNGNFYEREEQYETRSDVWNKSFYSYFILFIFILIQIM
jgi:hypothetical protein